MKPKHRFLKVSDVDAKISMAQQQIFEFLEMHFEQDMRDFIDNLLQNTGVVRADPRDRRDGDI